MSLNHTPSGRWGEGEVMKKSCLWKLVRNWTMEKVRSHILSSNLYDAPTRWTDPWGGRVAEL